MALAIHGDVSAAELRTYARRAPSPRAAAARAAIILRGPDPERDGISAYTREDLARLIAERFGRRYHPSSLSGVVRRLGFSR